MKLVFALSAGMLAMSVVPAAALTGIGKADSIVKSVRGTTEGATKPMSAGDEVFQDQIIETGSAARAELVFTDETRFSVGPDARAVLDTFVYDPKSKKGEVLIKASKGAFRFVTGIGKKENYKITTPVASIGVRGTTFHMFILNTGTTAIALVEGSVIICNLNGRCRTASTPGRVTFVLTSGLISREMGWGENYMRTIPINRALPFIRDVAPFSGKSGGGGPGGDGDGGDPDNENPGPSGGGNKR